jgi:hypothetical protein
LFRLAGADGPSANLEDPGKLIVDFPDHLEVVPLRAV